jgi:ABC-type transporter MlaC component
MFTLKNKTTFLLLTLCSLILGISLIGALQAASTDVYSAPSPDQARQFVANIIDEAKRIASDPKAQPADFGHLLSSKADIKGIARFILGLIANRMTPEQFEEFCSLYTQRLALIYSTKEKLEVFSGTTYTMDLRTSQKGVRVLVKTSFHLKEGGDPVRVDWEIVIKNGELYVVDIFFEMISKLIFERDDYRSTFNNPGQGGGDPSQFLAYLRKRVTEG